MKQTWNALTRSLRLSLVLCGGVIAACGDDATDSGADAGPETPSAGQTGSSGRGGSSGSAGRAGNNSAGTGASGAAGRAGSSGSAGASGAGTGGAGSDLDGGAEDTDAGAEGAGEMSFFVTSDTRPNGNLGGLSASDQRCQTLAAAVGAGSKTWHAYLSADSDATSGGPVNARDRIGAGPWYNQKGALLAADLATLHTIDGNADLFLDENGAKINGQWEGSPSPNQHDIFTGSNTDGTLMVGKTCQSWTSANAADKGLVGHSDGLGPNRSASPPLNSWNSVHENQDCSDTAPRGGAGKIYCFAID
jgi:hypothetical protein